MLLVKNLILVPIRRCGPDPNDGAQKILKQPVLHWFPDSECDTEYNRRQSRILEFQYCSEDSVL